MKKILILALIIFPYLIKGQILQRNSLPNFIPKKSESYLWQDTSKITTSNPFGGVIYTWNDNKWYANSTTIVREVTLPIDSIIINGNLSITINFTKVSWFKPSSYQYYRFKPPYSWVGDEAINFDSVVTIMREQRILGKKTFTDTVKFERGINSEGKITTNGISSSGSSNNPSLNLNGVASEKDTIINSNFVLNGNYGKIGVSNMSSNVNITVPNITNTKNWIFGIRKDDNSIYTVNIVDENSNLIYTLRNKMSIEIKNIDSNWKRIK